jgi:hypothetical protein
MASSDALKRRILAVSIGGSAVDKHAVSFRLQTASGPCNGILSRAQPRQDLKAEHKRGEVADFSPTPLPTAYSLQPTAYSLRLSCNSLDIL